MASNNIYGGRALRIAIVTLLVFSVFMGGAGALSDAAVSDNVRDNYPDIASLNGNFPDQPPGRPLDTPYPQRAEQLSNPVGTENMPEQIAAAGDVNITRIGHYDTAVYSYEWR